MTALAQSNKHLRDKEATRLRIGENVRQSSAFEDVKNPRASIACAAA